MKVKLFLSGAAIVVLAGCARDIRQATARKSVDISGGQTPSGQVDFYSDRNDAVVPIYAVHKSGDVSLLSGIGINPGDDYDFGRYGSTVAKRLTVTAPVGTQDFLIDREGPLVKVPVSEGKVTPVETHYQVIERGDVFVTYTADARVLPATEPPPAPAKKRK